MASLLTSPLTTEPLPPYRRRDPETSSIRSAAPSYKSETPTYTSTERHLSAPASATGPAPAPRRPQPSGLPALRFAPGFRHPIHAASSGLESHDYSIPSWSSIRGSHAARQYQAVASRRVSRASSASAWSAASASMSATVSGTVTGSGGGTSTAPGSSCSGLGSASLSAASGPSNGQSPPTADSPATGTDLDDTINPLEDPYLVGEEAAARTRSARLYREECARGEEALRNEGKTWDFLSGQMADWEERERSFKRFRWEDARRRKFLGRRNGLRSSF